MTNLFAEMNKETSEHFQEKRKDRWAGFKSHHVGGKTVIDLNSVDLEYCEYELHDNANDIARQGIYGDQARNPNKM